MAQFVVRLAVLAAVLCPCSVRAQTAESEAEARALFEAGREAFSAGSYEDALRDFERAYELSGRPELLYNVGSAAERLARDEDALEAYRAFIGALPEHPSRPEVERRIVVLEARLRARAAEPPSTPTPSEGVRATPAATAPEPTPERGGWLFSWVGLGATALAGGAAGLSWALANDAYASLEQTCSPTCSEQEIASSDVQARLDATTAMLIVTGVLAAATIVLFVIEAPAGHSSDESASAAVRAGPGRLELRGTF